MSRKARRKGGKSSARAGRALSADEVAILDRTFASAADHYRQRRFTDAERDLLEIQRRRRNIPQVLHMLALIALQTDRADAAIDHLNTVVKVGGESTEILSLLGGALAKIGRDNDAVTAYEKVVARDPDLADAHYNLGNALNRLDRVADAVRHYRKAATLKPDFADAHYNLALALTRMDRLEEALAANREALRLAPDDNMARTNLGALQYELGHPEEALKTFEKAMGADPNDAKAVAATATIRFEMRDFDRALQYAIRAANLAPEFEFGNACHFGEDFAARTSVAAFDRNLASLPEMTGTYPASTGERPVVMTSCDHRYFGEFARALILSADRFAAGHDFHLHIINPAPSFADELRELQDRLSATTLSVTVETEPGADRLYFATIRFVRLCQLLSATDRDYLHLDADSLVRGPLATLDAIDAAADLAIPLRMDNLVLRYKVLISSLFARPTEGGRRFMRRYAAYLAACISERNLPWGVDQAAFYIVYRMMGFDGEDVAVAPLPEALCDHELEASSEVWAAKGAIKENPKFAKACTELLADDG